MVVIKVDGKFDLQNVFFPPWETNYHTKEGMYECNWKRSENSTGLLMIAANDRDMDGERQRWNTKAYSLLHGILLERADVLSLFSQIHILLKKHTEYSNIYCNLRKSSTENSKS